MIVRLLPAAALELEQAAEWYAAQSAGLDQRFLDAVETARWKIVEHPLAWSSLGDGARRYRLARFPYGVIYVADDAEIVVVAIAHLHREPDYWRSRLTK